jgi:hypothetical protein
MPHHTIRLRGGWESTDTPDNAVSSRITLPLASLHLSSGPFKLIRSFQTPRLDWNEETLWLRLADVPGLISVVLNDRLLLRSPISERVVWLPLRDSVQARNRLVLEVDLERARNGLSAGMRWGDIALEIQRGVVSAPPPAER